MSPKQLAAERAAEYVQEGMVVGLGTGSTAAFAVRKLGQRVQAGLRIRGIPTSRATEALAREVGIPLIDFSVTTEIDLTIDGADEIDPALCLIKGGGGALLWEKIVARASREMIVVADASKVKAVLGAFPLPVEVVPFGHQATARHLAALGLQPTLRRTASGEVFVTDGGHYIFDCASGPILQPAELERALNLIPGVVENGLFVGLARRALLGHPDGTVEERLQPQGP
jgi:ribose 5-phosphate isomerase A